MSKLVDKERLAQLAKALDDRAKAAVKAEETRALAAEAAEKERAEAAEGALAARIADNEAFVAAQPAIDQAQNQRLDEVEALLGLKDVEEGEEAPKTVYQKIEGVQDNVDAVVERAEVLEEQVGQKRVEAAEGVEAKEPTGLYLEVENAQKAADQAQDEVDAVELRAKALEEFVEAHDHTAMQGEIDALEGRADALEAFKNGHSHEAMEKDIADNKAAIAKEVNDRDAAVEAVADRVAALESKVGVEGEDTVASQINTAVNAEKERAMGVEGALADRLDVIEGDGEGSIKKAVADLVNSAPENMNTLKELSDAIAAHQTVYEGYINTVNGQIATAKQEAIAAAANDAAAKDATLKAELQAEIDTDVKAEADRAKAEEVDIRADFAAADATLKADLQKEIDTDVKVEADRALAAEKVLADRLAVIEGDGEGSIKKAVAAEAALREGAVDAVADRVAALENAIGEGETALPGRMEAAEGEIDALQAFVNTHSHEAIEKGIADNKAAIEKEVKDRDAAIEEALKVYSTTEEMKVVLGNVVNSLALSMENNEMVLKLGGVDGIALTSTKLDIITDQDVLDIIAGLDAKPEA